MNDIIISKDDAGRIQRLIAMRKYDLCAGLKNHQLAMFYESDREELTELERLSERIHTQRLSGQGS